MKFKPKDAVWLRVPEFLQVQLRTAAGEYPAEIIEPINYKSSCSKCGSFERYRVAGVPGHSVLRACVCILRPRRDDYQQREGTVSMRQILSFLENEFENEVKRPEFVNAK